MSTFTRFIAVSVVVLSLGFLVAGLPAARSIPVITGIDAVSLVCAKAFLGIEAKINELLGCNNIAELKVAIHVIVALFKGCADDLLKIGAGVAVDVEAKATIVACIAAIITLLVKVCVQVSVKFGISVVAALFAEIDIVLHLLLVNLKICIDGIVVLIVKALTSVTVGLLAQVRLKLCLDVLGLTF